MSTDTGGPAFPSKKRVYVSGYSTEQFEPVDGMTLRDYFAAKALPGCIQFCERERWEWAAARAYKIADAMLKARET